MTVNTKRLLYSFLLTLAFVLPHTGFATTTTARALALKLVVGKESGAGYISSSFKVWTDDDRDGCDTRKEVLIAESKVRITLKAKCTVTVGKWTSWYDGKTWTKPSDVDIDHVVPLKEAWDSGAKFWSTATRTKYANDLDFGWSLDAITDHVNSSKGDKDPAQWLPPLASARCAYAIHWVAIKYRWKLTIDTAEQNKLLSILSGNCGSRTLTVPKVINTSTQTIKNTNTNTGTPVVSPLPIVVTPVPITDTPVITPVPIVVTPSPNTNINIDQNTNTNNTNTSTCCKICTTGKACGDSCINASYTCSKPPGCACQG